MTERPLRRQILAKLIPDGAVIAEIGVFRGEFSSELIELANPSRLYLVDPWEICEDPALKFSWYHPSSGNDMNAIFEEVIERFSSQIRAGQVDVVRGTVSDLAVRLDAEELDFVYVDGDHRFDAVLMDLITVMPKVKVGGHVMLDDYSLGQWWGDGVVRGLNAFLGAYPAHWRLVRAVGNQVVIQKI